MTIEVLNALQWIGGIIGVIGFWFLTLGKTDKSVTRGCWISLISLGFLIPWGIQMEAWGPVFIWWSIGVASIGGILSQGD